MIFTKIRKVIFTLLLSGIALYGANAQSNGDFRSNATGNWNAPATWQRYQGGTWQNPGGAGNNPGQYPGQNAGTGVVTIQNGHTVTLNVSPGNNIGSLVVGGGTSGTLTIGNNNTARTLNVNGNITVNVGGVFQARTVAGGTHALNIGGDLTNNGTVNFTAGSVVNTTLSGNAIIAGSAAATTTFNNLVIASGTRTFGNNTNARTINITNNFTINAGATFQSGNTGATAHTINVGGNFTNNGTFNLTANSATNQLLVFNGTAAQTISGSGSNTFYNVTLSTSATDVNVNNSITINGTLLFSTNRIMVVNASSDVTLGATATISGATANRYIQVDGTTGANSNLIRVSDGTTGPWQFTFPIGTSENGYTPVTIPTITTAPDANSTLAVKVIYAAGETGLLRRAFRFTVVGNDNGTTFSNALFNYYDADVFPGDVEADYTLAYRRESGTLSTVAASINTGANTFTVNGGTLATATLNTGTYSYTIGRPAARVWYSYQTGNFNDFNTWTLDPSGTTFDNGLNIFPVNGDEIHILNGYTVTVNINNRSLSVTEIQGGGILNLSTTTGHNLGTVIGTGLLRIQGTALPTATYTDFVATTGGTIEYYNTAGTLSTTQTQYNNLRMTNTAGDITYTLASNMTVNGTFEIGVTGAGIVNWQINNSTASRRTIVLNGDLTVGTVGRIRASSNGVTGPHILDIYGNFVNNGIVKFFDTSDAQLSDANYTSGSVYTLATKNNAVNVTFKGTADQTVTCNNTTDFYRFIVDKGLTQQPMVTVVSSAAGNMRLFGPANLGGTSIPSNNALSIQNGTLQLTGTLTIPRLCADGAGTAGNDYLGIPPTGALWLNSAGVNVTVADNTASNDDQRILVNGLLKVSAGTLNSGYGRGLGSNTGGVIMIEGGTVNTWQYRPIVGSQNVSYIQTGGTFNVGMGGVSGPNDNPGTQNYARFSIPSTTSSFQMTGGVLNVGRGYATAGGTPPATATGIDIRSDEGNFVVTGGMVNVYVSNGTTNNFTISSTAPFYNLNIIRESGSTATTVGLNSELKILNNLTIVNGNTPTFNCNGNNLSIGGNFEIQNGTTFTPGGILTFNGTGAQTWIRSGTISAVLPTIVVDKTGTLTVQNALGQNITNLTLTNGTLADNGNTLTVTGTLTNNATHTSTGTGSITYTAVNGTINGNNGTFGNLILTGANSNAITGGNQTIKGNLQLNGATRNTLYISEHNLTVDGTISTTQNGGVLSANWCIYTNGQHNAGGLARQGSATDILFPVGARTGTGPFIYTYTPNTINVTAATHGKITVRPVIFEHNNVTATGLSLKYYWNVTSAGYSGITAVAHKNYTFSDNTLVAGDAIQKASYRPARFDRLALQWAYYNVIFDATAATAISPASFSTGTDWFNIASDQLDGEYTCGHAGAFDVVTVFYSKANGNWNTASTWSNVSHSGADASTQPCATCPVIIGDGTSINHTVNINANNVTCGSLILNTGSTLDCASFNNVSLGTNTSGRGTLRVSNTVFPTGDFITFVGPNGGTVEWYGAAKTLPNTYTAPAPSGATQSLASYYNLIINPNVGATITLPTVDLTIYNNLTTMGGTTATTATAARTHTINGNVNVTSGTFQVTNNTAATSSTFVVMGNTTIAAGASMLVQNANTGNHTFLTQGSITNDGTLNLRRSATQYMNLTFTETNNVTFGGTGSGGTTLNLVTVNKGTSQTPTVTFSMSGTINTTTATNGWLILQNGTFDFANPGTFITTLSNNSSYTIPSKAKLRVSGTNVTLNTTSTDATGNDLLLNGALEIAGGTVNVGSTTGAANDVDIEYASAGTPTINVSGSGSLWVRSSIRRPTNTTAGALVYNQTGGTVTVGGIASANTRGVFEIDHNAGSSFTLTGTGTLNVQRQNNGSGFADVHINPVTSNVSPTSTITVGLGTATTQNNLRVYITPTIGNFSVQNGNGTNSQTVLLYNNMALGGTLTIPAPSVLDATTPIPDANVTIGGNFNCTGSYNAGENTTTFNGAGAQSATLSANTDFYNVTISKAGGTTLTLTGAAPTAPALNNLELLSGILDVGNINLTVERNITINGSQVGTGSITVYSDDAGISNTITSSGGSFTNLTLGGTLPNRTVNVSGNLTINGTLNFSTTNRYLMIGSYSLTFGVSAPAVSGAGITAFIRTNGVGSDLGVIKNWGTGTGTFVYPIGTAADYTPVSYSLNVANAGTLTVVPVNSPHLTYNQASSEQILNYYWTVRRGASLNATASGSFTFGYPSSMISGSGGTLLAGYLDPNPVGDLGWITDNSEHGGSATTTQMTFTSTPTTNFPPANSYYDYTVGTIETLPNPILPLYSRVTGTNVTNLAVGGEWTTASNWTTDTDGDPDGDNPSLIVPNGVPVVILNGTRINTALNGRRVFKITIHGLLNNGTTVGHNFGTLEGTGTFRTATNTFPAGDYTPFVSSSGGTIEYVAPMEMNSRDTYNHLSIFSGSSGLVTMPATPSVPITVNGNITIPVGTTLGPGVNNPNMNVAGSWNNAGTTIAGATSNWSIAGNLTSTGTYSLGASTIMSVAGTLNNSGAFNSGTSSVLSLAGNLTNTGTFNQTTGTVAFNGSAAQSITGSTVFNNLTVNKTNNLTLGATTTVNGVLTLNNGHIITSSSNLLVLGAAASSAGASANSFVAGPMSKGINSAASFTFPLGSISAGYFRPASIGNASALDTWTAEYIGNNPGNQGYDNTAHNLANIARVSRFEYWNISRAGAANANVTLTYNTGSYDPPDIGNVNNLRVARWNGTLWDLPPGGGSFSQSGTNITGTVTVTNVTSFSPFTLASLDANSPLPVELDKLWAEVVNDGVDIFWETASELNSDYFTVERSVTGETFTAIGKVAGKGTTNQRSRYMLKDTNPVHGTSYYRVKQTDFDGSFAYSKVIAVNYEGPSMAFMNVYPNPANGSEITIEINGLKGVEEIPVIILDQLGKETYRAILRVNGAGFVSNRLVFENPVADGVYIVRAGATLSLTKRLIIINRASH